MKVILKQDVKGKGKKGQLIEATPGISCCPRGWRWRPPPTR